MFTKSENCAEFLTSRPFLWVKAFHKYAEENHIKCRWEHTAEPVHGKCPKLKWTFVSMDTFKLASGSLMV